MKFIPQNRDNNTVQIKSKIRKGAATEQQKVTNERELRELVQKNTTARPFASFSVSFVHLSIVAHVNRKTCRKSWFKTLFDVHLLWCTKHHSISFLHHRVVFSSSSFVIFIVSRCCCGCWSVGASRQLCLFAYICAYDILNFKNSFHFRCAQNYLHMFHQYKVQSSNGLVACFDRVKYLV